MCFKNKKYKYYITYIKELDFKSKILTFERPLKTGADIINLTTYLKVEEDTDNILILSFEPMEE